MKKIVLIYFNLICLICISGCMKDNVMEEIYDYMEQTVQIEKEFEDKSEEIYQLEKRDEAIYDEVIALNGESYDKMEALIDEALLLVEERRNYLEEEKETIAESKRTFKKIESLITTIEEEDQKRKVEKLVDSMFIRYETYDTVYEKYLESLKSTEQLYDILKRKDVKERDLYNQLIQLNQLYEDVNLAYETFNNQTDKFNEQKKRLISEGEKN